jgi:hypothetical protein
LEQVGSIAQKERVDKNKKMDGMRGSGNDD